MGIDCYLIWDGQTEEERQAQYTGFATNAGHVGYLREAYHGGPYAIRVLAPEAFVDHGDDGDGVPIPANTLRERLASAIEASKQRYLANYKETLTDEDAPIVSLRAFVDLAEAKERDGKNPRVHISA